MVVFYEKKKPDKILFRNEKMHGRISVYVGEIQKKEDIFWILLNLSDTWF